MSFYGMDTAQVQDHSQSVEVAARRLEKVMSRLQGTVSAVEWVGPDADRFQSDFGALRGQADDVFSGLHGRAADLRGHVEEQDSASAVEGAGGGLGDAVDGVLGWLGDRGRDVVDAVEGGLDWLGDRAGDLWDGITGAGESVVDSITDGASWLSDKIGQGMDWTGDRIRDGLDFLGGKVEDGKRMLDSAVSAIRDFEWPSLSELGVEGLSAAVRGAGFLRDLLPGEDRHWAEDGTGYADAPREVTPEASSLRSPSDLAEIVRNTNNSYAHSGGDDAETGTVSMTVVNDGDGRPQGVIVNIPGTEKWGPGAGDNPFDLTGNAELAGLSGTSAGTEATADAIRQLYADQNIPPGTPIMLNGHSQGGMVAASLAGDPDFTSEFTVTNLMTYGSPVDNLPAVEGIDQINIAHSHDLVPKLDGGGFPTGGGTGTDVVVDSGKPFYDVGGNHSGDTYRETIAREQTNLNSPIHQYAHQPSMAPFLTADGDRVQHFQSDVHRKHD